MRFVIAACALLLWALSPDETFGQVPAVLYYIHVDHLNTPRAIYDQHQQLVWRWDQAEPFGNSPPNENPAGIGTFEWNLRFPGQYFDKETNLAYNYFRDFDPGLGRYVQSDPVGLRGGLNTYEYVRSLPTSWSDPAGLWAPHLHKLITEYGLERAGTCGRHDPFIATGTGNVDTRPGSQEPANSRFHGMCDATRPDIVGQFLEYLHYKENLRKSCRFDDLFDLLHAVQDEDAPGHRAFACWKGFRATNPGRLFFHGLGDVFIGASSWERAVAATAEEIAAFKTRCPCACQP